MFVVTIKIEQDAFHQYKHPDVELSFRASFTEDIKRNVATALTIANVPSEEDDDKYDKGGVLPC